MTSDGGPRALGIVPVGRDGPALSELDGVPLVRRAVAALRASGRVGQVLVPVPAALVGPVTAALADGVGAVPDGVRVVPLPDAAAPDAALHAALDAALHAALDAAGPVPAGATVVVHDVLHPLAAPELVRGVVDALAAASPEVAGAVAVRPVTDTLKWVADDGTITGTADRGGYRVVCSPQAYRAAVLRGPGVPADPADLPAAAGRCGRLLAVPAPQEVFRVAGADDLELAAAVLASSPVAAGGGQGIR